MLVRAVSPRCLLQARALGLGDDVASFGDQVQSRAKQASAALQQAQDQGSVTSFADAVQACTGLGLESQVTAAVAAVEARKEATQMLLVKSAGHDTLSDFNAALEVC